LRDRAVRKQELDRVYGYFNVLADRSDQKASTLSGGEQQMLAIARGLMLKPKLLLLDEPSLGLAPLIVEHLAQIIAKLHREGLTILLVEQNARLALELADRGYVMENGSVAVKGAASDLLQSDLVKRAYLGL
jgi:branched-chain amino acid transport system ATP-binding protein